MRTKSKVLYNLAASQWAHYWYYQVGVNPIPRVGKIPLVPYKQFRNKRIPEELFTLWIDQGNFNENMCVMIGKLSAHTELLSYARKGLFLNFADLDNQLAINEFCTYKDKKFTLEQMSKICYVVQHADKSHCHIYWLASKPLPKRTLDKDKKILAQIRNNQIPSIEIKGAGDIAFCPGGKHESGNYYLPIGTHELCIMEELNEHMESICRKYDLPVSDVERIKLRRLAIARCGTHFRTSRTSTKTLYDYEGPLSEDWTDIYENSRNNTLFNRARRYLRKNKDLLSADTFRKVVHSWNQKYCKPPLDPAEIDSICNSILNHNNGGHD